VVRLGRAFRGFADTKVSTTSELFSTTSDLEARPGLGNGDRENLT
jgi:hypothetical protein